MPMLKRGHEVKSERSSRRADRHEVHPERAETGRREGGPAKHNASQQGKQQQRANIGIGEPRRELDVQKCKKPNHQPHPHPGPSKPLSSCCAVHVCHVKQGEKGQPDATTYMLYVMGERSR